MTTYLVLRRVSNDSAEAAGWVEVGRADAANDVAAIKAVAKETGTDLSNGAVAVPARSWKPRKPTVKREERTLWT